MQIRRVEVEPEPQRLLFVDQLKNVMQCLAVADGVMIADFADEIFGVTPTDGMRQHLTPFGTVVHDHADFFVDFFFHYCS